MNCWTETAHVARDGLLQACTRFSFTYYLYLVLFLFLECSCYLFLFKPVTTYWSECLTVQSLPFLSPPPSQTEQNKDIKMMNSVHLECGHDRVIFQKTSCYLYSGKCCAAEWYKSQGKVRFRLCDRISTRFTAGGALCMETGESE